jgi:hypothetical protein
MIRIGRVFIGPFAATDSGLSFLHRWRKRGRRRRVFTSAIIASQYAWVELLPMRIFLQSSPDVITIVVAP